MKEALAVMALRWRAGFHWNRMIAKQDKTALTHSTLMVMDCSYRRSNTIYNDCISRLVSKGRYTTAMSIIAEKKSVSHATRVCSERN